ncbi:MAG: DUF6125 family protein [Bacillota bacterium]
MKEKILELEKEQILKLSQKIIANTNIMAFFWEEACRSGEKVDPLELTLKINRLFGDREARGLINMGLVRSAGLDGIQQALSYSHWAVMEELRIERLNESTLRFGIVNCSTKRAMDGIGRELNCRKTGTELRQSFIEVIDSRARVLPVTAPPDGINGIYSCLWEVNLVNDKK